MKLKSPSLFDFAEDKKTKQRYARVSHGGDIAKGKRKLERPLSTKHFIHLCLKSSKATGKLSLKLPKNEMYIDELVRKKARKFGIKIDRLVNVKNHLHMKIKISSRENFKSFLKSITAQIARFVTGARKGKPFGKFWNALAFTRVIKSRREEIYINGYFDANHIESNFSYREREQYLKFFKDWVSGLFVSG